MKYYLIILVFLINFENSVLGQNLSSIIKVVKKFDDTGKIADVWKMESRLDSIIKRLGNETTNKLSSKNLAKNLGKADDLELIKILDNLTDGERHVLGSLNDSISIISKSFPAHYTTIIRDGGPESIYRATILKDNAHLYYEGLHLEGKSFNKVLDKGGKNAVEFYHQNFKSLRKKHLDDAELENLTIKFKSNPQRYMDANGKPTKLGLNLIDDLKKIGKAKSNVFTKIKHSSPFIASTVWQALKSVATSLLALLPAAYATASNIAVTACGLLITLLTFIFFIAKHLITFFKKYSRKIPTELLKINDLTLNQKKESNSEKSKNVALSSINNADTEGSGFTKTSGSNDKRTPQKQYNLQQLTDYHVDLTQRPIPIGLLGVRAAGKSTFLVMLNNLPFDLDNKIGCLNIETEDEINNMEQSLTQHGKVEATNQKFKYFFSFSNANKKQITHFRIEDYPGEELKPSREGTKEFRGMNKWLSEIKGLILFLDPQKADEKEIEELNLKDPTNRKPLFRQDDAIPKLLHKMRSYEIDYPHPLVCVLTKLDAIPDDEKDWQPDELIKKYFPTTYEAVKSFAKRHTFQTISSLGMAISTRIELGNLKPNRIDQPIDWLLENIPEAWLENILKNKEQKKFDDTLNRLKEFIEFYPDNKNTGLARKEMLECVNNNTSKLNLVPSLGLYNDYIKNFSNNETLNNAKAYKKKYIQKNIFKSILYGLGLVYLIFIFIKISDNIEYQKYNQILDDLTVLSEKSPEDAIEKCLLDLPEIKEALLKLNLFSKGQTVLETIAKTALKKLEHDAINSVENGSISTDAISVKFKAYDDFVVKLKDKTNITSPSEKFRLSRKMHESDIFWGQVVVEALKGTSIISKLDALQQFINLHPQVSNNKNEAKALFNELKLNLKGISEECELVFLDTQKTGNWSEGIEKLVRIKLGLKQYGNEDITYDLLDSFVVKLKIEQQSEEFRIVQRDLDSQYKKEPEFAIKRLDDAIKANENKTHLLKLCNEERMEIGLKWKQSLFTINSSFSNLDELNTWMSKMKTLKSHFTIFSGEIDSNIQKARNSFANVSYERVLKSLEGRAFQRKNEDLDNFIREQTDHFKDLKYIEMAQKLKKDNLGWWSEHEYREKIYEKLERSDLYDGTNFDVAVSNINTYLDDMPFSKIITEERKAELKKIILLKDDFARNYNFIFSKILVGGLPKYRTDIFDPKIRILIDDKLVFELQADDKIQWIIDEPSIQPIDWSKNQSIRIELIDVDALRDDQYFIIKQEGTYSFLKLINSPSKFEKWADDPEINKENYPTIEFFLKNKLFELTKPDR